MSETTPARATSNQSTEKAFAVLELLSEAQGPMQPAGHQYRSGTEFQRGSPICQCFAELRLCRPGSRYPAVLSNLQDLPCG